MKDQNGLDQNGLDDQDVLDESGFTERELSMYFSDKFMGKPTDVVITRDGVVIWDGPKELAAQKASPEQKVDQKV
jgi:hypothetical protein